MGMLNTERDVGVSNGRVGREQPLSAGITACLEASHSQRTDISGNKVREDRSSITINFVTAIVLFAVEIQPQFFHSAFPRVVEAGLDR